MATAPATGAITLRLEVVEHIYRDWLVKIWYLNVPGISDEFTRYLAAILVGVPV